MAEGKSLEQFDYLRPIWPYHFGHFTLSSVVDSRLDKLEPDEEAAWRRKTLDYAFFTLVAWLPKAIEQRVPPNQFKVYFNWHITGDDSLIGFVQCFGFELIDQQILGYAVHVETPSEVRSEASYSPLAEQVIAAVAEAGSTYALAGGV